MARALLLVACLSLASTVSAGDPNPTTRIVPTDYETITAAIDASNAGDEIIVKPGTYDESLLIDGAFGLTLRAQKAGSVRVTGTEGIVVSNSVRVEIFGLDVEGATDAAVFFNGDTTDCRLDRVSVIAGEDSGITLFGDRHVATRCSVEAADFFAYFVDGANTVLSRCSASNGDIAMFLNGQNHTVIDCKIKDMNIGVVMGADNALVANTTFTKIDGVALDIEGEFITARGNRIRKARCGIDIDEPATIIGNRITKVDDIAINVDSDGVVIADNIAAGSRVGLQIEIGTDATRVVSNKIRGSSEADIVDGGLNTISVDNNFKTLILTGT